MPIEMQSGPGTGQRADRSAPDAWPPDGPPIPAQHPSATAQAEALDGRPTPVRPHRLRRIGNALVRFWDTRRTPAFLVSFIVHTAVLLVLALWSWSYYGDAGQEFDFDAMVLAPHNEPQVEVLLDAGAVAPPASWESFQPSVPQSATTAPGLAQLLQPTPTNAAQAEAAQNLQQLLSASSMELTSTFVATGVEGRSLDKRRQVALENGGTLESEEAVELALEWLAAHQLPTGAWSLRHDTGTCNGRCRHPGSKDRFDTAATGLSLLAFLGAGYTHQAGKHRETVRKGVYFLLQVMEETPQGGSFLYQSDRGMYNHGIAAFALCEAYQLSQDEDLREPAQQALNFIASAQNYFGGGWGYLPRQPGDLTISGWQIMALKSGYAAGLEVPPAVLLRIDQFLDSKQTESGVYFGYRKPERSPTCTAIGQLVRLFRGRSHSDPRVLEAADYFMRSGRSSHDVYFNYYVSLFLFHIGDPFWEQWNPRMREHLIKTQMRQGHEAGSWYFDNPYGQEGGRLYTTAMAAMTLEVYYRFAPLYQQTEIDFEL